MLPPQEIINKALLRRISKSRNYKCELRKLYKLPHRMKQLAIGNLHDEIDQSQGIRKVSYWFLPEFEVG